MKIAIASDHAGFEQKQHLVVYLSELGHEVFDLGPDNEERVDYPDFAVKVARQVQRGEAQYGVLVCGTGIGMAITANKIPSIRASVICTPEFAVLSREHNDVNVIALSGRFVELELNKKILDSFLSTAFGGGRHMQRVEKINKLDQGV